MALPVADLPPTATKPVRFKALRAALIASHHALAPLLAKAFFARSEAFLETILPLLFLMKLALVIPLWVFCFLPLKTCALAILPLAMTLTFFAFMLLAFMAFMAAAFFMGSAIAVKRRLGKCCVV